LKSKLYSEFKFLENITDFRNNAVFNFLQLIDFYDSKILKSKYGKTLSLKINNLEK